MTAHSYTIQELAKLVGGSVTGDGDVRIDGVAGIKEAAAGEITFLANDRYAEYVGDTCASAIVLMPDMECGLPAIRHDDPYLAFLKIVTVFAGTMSDNYPRGVHSTAVVEDGAEIGENVAVGPCSWVGRGARIGAGTTVMAGAQIGRDVIVGCECIIYHRVTIEAAHVGDRVILHPGVVVGSDGFGFAREGEVYRKIPHIGKVVIEDDVEIGSNTTIDRGTMGETRIGQGTKVDNLVQIAHNVNIGKNTVIAGQAGIAGSTTVGDGVVIAGQVGLAGHLTIGDKVTIGAKSAVFKSIDSGVTVTGIPARPHDRYRRLWGLTARLPDLNKRIRQLEKKIEQLEAGQGNGQATEDDR